MEFNCRTKEHENKRPREPQRFPEHGPNQTRQIRRPSHLLDQEAESALQLCEHPVEGDQQHLSRAHFRSVLYGALHVPRLYQLRVLDTQNPEEAHVQDNEL